MKVTGYRVVRSVLDWGRRIGDVNGVADSELMPVTVLVLETDVGLEGVAVGATSDVELLFGAVDGRDPRSVTGLYDRMLAHTFKAGHAGTVFGTIGSLDTALWDLKAKAADEPLWRLLGAVDRRVPGYASGLDAGLSDDDLHAFYRGYAALGFGAAKLKGGRDVHDDLRRLEVVRDALGRTDPVLALDANEYWNPKQAVRHIAHLERAVDLAWVEEPVRRWDVRGLRQVSAQVRAAVATGENLTGIEQLMPLLAADAVDIVQANAGWGPTFFLRAAAVADAHQRPISSVGHFLPIAAAAAAVPNAMAIEVQTLDLPAGIQGDFTIDEGCVVLGQEPGVGLALDEAAAARASAAATWSSQPLAPHVRPAGAGLGLGLTTSVAGEHPAVRGSS
jgi:L-alanine-DL-glutamate epimerase-like enolase superfamily enzyme